MSDLGSGGQGGPPAIPGEAATMGPRVLEEPAKRRHIVILRESSAELTPESVRTG